MGVDSCFRAIDSLGPTVEFFLAVIDPLEAPLYISRRDFLEKTNAQSRPIILMHFQALKHSFQSNPSLKIRDTSFGAQGKKDILSKCGKNCIIIFIHLPCIFLLYSYPY